MNVVLVASIHGLAGRAPELVQVLAELRDAALAEPGCSDFRVARDTEDAAELLVVGTWRDEAALRAHFASADYSRYVDAVTPLLARPSDAVIHYAERSVRPVGDASSDPARQG